MQDTYSALLLYSKLKCRSFRKLSWSCRPRWHAFTESVVKLRALLQPLPKMAASTSASSSGHTTEPVVLCDTMAAEDFKVKRRHVQTAFDELGTDEDSNDKTILSAVWQAGMLGLSFYVVETACLYYMLDSVEKEDFLLLSRALGQIAPQTIVLSSKQDERMKDAVKAYLEGDDGEEEGEAVSGRQRSVEVLPSADFFYDSCRRRILALPCLPGAPSGEMSDDQRQIYLSSLIPLESQAMVRSMGALLKFLDKHRVGVELEDSAVRIPLLGVKAFTLEDLVIVDDNSYCALQIFHKERHPSVYKAQQSGCKEGLSLFGVANKTRSKLGSQLLRLWFLRPLKNMAVLQERQEAVAFFAQPGAEEAVGSLRDCLRSIKNLPRVLARMSTAQAAMTDWQALYKTVYSAVHIGELCRTLSQDVHICRKIAASFSEELQKIASLISRIIDFEESSSANRFVVKPGVDPDLDEKKRTYNGLPDFMTEIARQELANLSEDIQECNVIYLPQLGYLLALQKPVQSEDEDFEIEGLQFVFCSNNTVYYKSHRTRELDALLGDTQCDIIDHETAIMHKLQEVVLERAQLLLAVMERSAELDCLLALALFAKEHSLVRPHLTLENKMAVKAGRHPLQELCVTAFVPNDAVFEAGTGRMKVLTGPNASGKSVYLKQVGLIVFLAHIGSFVPAESAVVGMVDAIFTRIHTRETVSLPMSTFMIDLNQVSNAVRNCSQRSLVILDEFGKGTATNDGLSLLTAVLRHWMARAEDCPRVLVSTHFHSLLQQALLPRSPLLHYQTMEVLEEGRELVFLYRLVDGRSDCSQACHIAASVGLPPAIIERGAQVSELIQCNQHVGRRDTGSMDAQLKRSKAITARFLSLDLDRDDVHAFLKDFILPIAEGMS